MNLRITAAAAVAILAVVAIAQTKYIVKRGDTLGGIAAKTGASAKSIASHNGIKGDKALQIGAKLLIPTSRTSKPAAKVNQITTSKVRVNAQDVVIRSGASATAKKVTTAAKGTTAFVVGKKGAWYCVKFANGVKGYVRGDFLNAVRSNSSKVTFASNVKRSYIVSSGDNDNKIAAKLGVSLSALHSANPGIKWSRLPIGKTLSVPSSSKTVAKLANHERINWIDTRSVKVNRDAVVIRRQPSTRSEKITTVDMGTKAAVLGRSGAWYKLKFPKGSIGFVRGDYLNEVKPVAAVTLISKRSSSRSHKPTSRRVYAHRDSGGNVTFADAGSGNGDIVSEAKRYLGTRYHWGGQSTRGFDCSGFVRYVYRKSTGVTLPRTSKEQSRTGTKVSRNELRPGDLISFSSRGGSSRVNHSGIYVGNNKFIHASSGKGRVVVSELTGTYAKRYVAAHRPAGSKTSTAKKPLDKKAIGPDVDVVKPKADDKKQEIKAPDGK